MHGFCWTKSAHVLPGQRGVHARGRGNERDGGTEEQTNRSRPSGPMGAHSLHRHIAVTSASCVTSGKQVHVGTELLAYRDTHGKALPYRVTLFIMKSKI